MAGVLQHQHFHTLNTTSSWSWNGSSLFCDLSGDICHKVLPLGILIYDVQPFYNSHSFALGILL